MGSYQVVDIFGNIQGIRKFFWNNYLKSFFLVIFLILSR